MMGVGKSTIGKKLAKKLKYKFSDIDKIIENKDKSINLSSQYNNLVQFEKDLTNQIKSYDNDIKELYKVSLIQKVLPPLFFLFRC